jgi:hypothetical protein
MAFLRLRIISKNDQYKAKLKKKEIFIHQIHSFELEMLMFDDYFTVLKEIKLIYEP